MLLTCLALSFSVAAGGAAFAQVPIRYDRSFSSDGLVRLPGDMRTGSHVANAPGEKLILGLNRPQAVMRFKSSGRVDRAFGEKGIARIRAGSRVMGQSDLMVDRRGRVLIGGSLRIADHNSYRAGIARLHEDGSPDLSFGQRGLAMPARLKSASVMAMTFLSRGRIMAAGQLKSDRKTDRVFAARFGPGGNLDKSFGDRGVRVLKFPSSQSNTDVAVDHRGRIVIGTGSSNPPWWKTDWIFAVARLTPDGDLDPSFSGDGIATVNPLTGTWDAFSDLTIDRAGRIVMVGWGGGSTASIVRFKPDGRLDESFADAGRKSLYMADATSVAVDDRGRIIVGGYDPGDYGWGPTAMVHRLLPSGQYDPTLTDCFGFCSTDFYGFGDLVIDDRNRVVLAPIYSKFGLVRLING